ncbi:MAG: YceH family protein [Betaproteobacteria bacterium]|nr:YceH family protein [Betaproteobacteria bacterium]
MIEFNLCPFEARVLGVLSEKQFLTPDVYPLSLNAIVNASNQLSNREPVMSLSEETVEACLKRLQDNHLAQTYYPAGSRVAKFQHMLREVFSLDDAKLSLVTLLLLRGPQTCGELRGRTGRMYPFASVDSVERSLNELAAHEPPLTMQLPRAPGTKEARWAHLLSGEMAIERQEIAAGMSVGSNAMVEGGGDDRVTRLEEEVNQLKREVAWLTEELLKFKKQFE